MDDRIEEKMEKIEEYFSRLDEVRDTAEGIAKEESEENLVRKIVSATIDIASRMIALEGGGRPDTYAEYFSELKNREIIDEELSNKLKEMARFRNLVVHQYHRIEQEQLDEIIENDLDDVQTFLTQVDKYYNSEK